MKLTSGQSQVLHRLLAFMDGTVDDADIAEFFAWNERGITPTKWRDGSAALVQTWQFTNRDPYHGGLSLQQRMWLEGHLEGEAPLAWICADLVRDAMEDIGSWDRMWPLWSHFLDLCARIGSGAGDGVWRFPKRTV